jgi:alpha-L-fucosidase
LILLQGPAANGSVITEERGPLLEIGRWLKQNGEAIYSTAPWYIQQSDISTSPSTSLRFTTTRDAFYVIILGDKGQIGQAGGVSTNAPLPILPGDHVTVLGAPDHVIDWNIKDNVISFNLHEDDLPGDYAWSLKIKYT